jgi:hypothetical protein
MNSLTIRDRREPPINKFNAEVLIPELHALGKMVKVLRYPGEPHCFCFYGSGPRTPLRAAPAVSLPISGLLEDSLKSTRFHCPRASLS